MICRASAESRNWIEAATSSVSLSRPVGVRCAAAAQASSDSEPCLPGSLRVNPGTTALTVMPAVASWSAKHLTSASSAALATEEAGAKVGCSILCAMNELTATTRPEPEAARLGIAAMTISSSAPGMSAIA